MDVKIGDSYKLVFENGRMVFKRKTMYDRETVDTSRNLKIDTSKINNKDSQHAANDETRKD
jgi:hypothetical protein